MYNNIDTEHAIIVISWWLKALEKKDSLPANFPIEAIIHAMKIIMRNTIFEWGDMCFLQLLGKAMQWAHHQPSCGQCYIMPITRYINSYHNTANTYSTSFDL